MTYYRQILDDVSEVVIIPPEFRHRRIELIILSLDDIPVHRNGYNHKATEKDANGWPVGFFEQTFGAIPDFPDREPQGEYEVREELL